MIVTSGNSGPPGGALTDPQQGANGGMLAGGAEAQPGEVKEDPDEEKLVSKLWKTYERARKFDENFRKQVAIDRRYASGTSDLSWAVTTNLIGVFIDILTAILYARDPDVSVKKAEQVDEFGTAEMEAFALTLQIVISHLWRRGKLKKAAKKGVRSVLSTAEGWLKCNMISEKDPHPETQKALNDARETVARLHAQIQLLEDPQDKDPETLEAEKAEKEALVEELSEKLELAVNKMFAIDFIRTERMQVSTDVESIEDYLDSDWIGDEQYILKEDALERFPRLKTEDLESAKSYYQNEPKEMTTRDLDNALPQGTITAETAQAYTASQSANEAPAFLRAVEIWDRRDKHIRTMIDGVKKWAKEPFTPNYPTSRFYPYFYFSFYEVDGQRHAQSLSWRLYKLQDEYSCTRSNFRITRERSIPGVFFNATALDEAEARKISDSKLQEYTAVRPSNPETPLANLFAPKPVAGIDMRLYDPSLILNDMERISGVQEALQSAMSKPGNPVTATEANIQQSGTAARTSTDRDCLEDMLTDMAQYTAEQALPCLTSQEAMRIAGKMALWPTGMSIEDLFTLVEVTITAGSTGKPKNATDQQAWAQALPEIKGSIQEIRQALAAGDQATAQSLTELLKETMKRLGDETDVSRFLPKAPPPGSPGAGAPPPADTPKINVSIKGMIDPATSAQLVMPALAQDQRAMQPPPPPPGAAPPGAPPSAPPMPPPGGGLPPPGQ